MQDLLAQASWTVSQGWSVHLVGFRTSQRTGLNVGLRYGLGMLVTLEGLDGSGKTTVHEALQSSFPGAVFTAEPTDSWIGDMVRRSMNDDSADPLAELFLYTADHAGHLADTIRPALTRGELVISDRYSDSRFAYQATTLSARFDEPLAYVKDIHEPFSIRPDLTIYFDIDPETAAERADRANKFEHAEFLARVRANYERLLDAEPSRFVRINATQPVPAVTSAVEDAITETLE